MRPVDLVGPLPDEHLPPLTVSVKTARRLLGVGNSKIWQMIADGRIQTITFDGKKRWVIYASLQALIEERLKQQATDQPPELTEIFTK